MALVKRKLKSQSGASIILAMLLLLLCIMIGSSILAAGMSNAGKGFSMRTAQQEYFMVKSAIELVCGELEKLEYKGKYTFSGEEFHCCDLPDHTFADHMQFIHYELKYVMKQGELSGTVQLPDTFKNEMRDSFDRLYAVPFYYASSIPPLSEEVYQRTYIIDPDPALGLGPRFDGPEVSEKQTDPYKFVIKVNDSSGSFPGFASNIPLRDKTVDVTVEIIESDLSLKVTAEITGTGSNKMEALMRTDTTPPVNVFTAPTDADASPYGTPSPVPVYTRQIATPLKWKAEYIRKAVD